MSQETNQELAKFLAVLQLTDAETIRDKAEMIIAQSPTTQYEMAAAQAAGLAHYFEELDESGKQAVELATSQQEGSFLDLVRNTKGVKAALACTAIIGAYPDMANEEVLGKYLNEDPERAASVTASKQLANMPTGSIFRRSIPSGLVLATNSVNPTPQSDLTKPSNLL